MIVFAFLAQLSFGQQKTVTGVVKDETGLLPGVTVTNKSDRKSSATDFDGKYAIKADEGDILTFSFVGYSTKSIAVSQSNKIDVVLANDAKVIEEVVVGYSKTLKKDKLNSSVVSVSAESIQDRPNLNFLQTLQSQVAGLAIAFNSGSPGSNKVDAIIRGESSINGTNDPLYVIDGVPLNQGFFRNLNPNDIESASVLKDAAATSIYGNRGAAGVIVITTKKGKYKNDFSVNYSSLYGQSFVPNDKYDLTDGKQQLRFQRELLPLIGLSGFGNTLTQAEYDNWSINTDWKKIFYRTAATTQQNLSFTSGAEKMNNYTSFGYLKQEGILPNTDFQRFTFRTNFNGKSANEKFTYSTNINANFSKRRQVEQETRGAIGANIIQNPVNGYLKSARYLDPAFYQSGQQIFNAFGANVQQIVPYTLYDLLQSNNLANFYNELKIFANTEMAYKITKNITYGFNIGFDYADDKRVFASGPNSYLAIVRNQTLATPAAFGGNETQTNNAELSVNVVNKLNFNKTFNGKHTIDFTVYNEYSKSHFRQNVLTQNGLNPLTWVAGAGTGWIPFNPATPAFFNKVVSAFTANAGLLSYFAVADYDYANLFGIGASVRRDASYKFIGENKWGTFWSVSGRFNLHNLDAVKKTGLFDELRLRASYGTTGNQNVPARGVDAQISPIFLGSQLVRDLNSAQTGYLNNPSFGVASVANPNLKWETTAQTNVGIDFNIKNRVIGTFDYYKKTTSDLYLPQNVSAITLLYNLDANNGVLENRGVELSLRFKIIRNSKNFKLDIFAQGSKNTNEIKELPLGIGQKFLPSTVSLDQINQPGGPIDQYNLVPYIGVDQTNGKSQFLDINGNITNAPTEADRRPTGKNRLPVYQGNFGTDISYKGFYLNGLFSFAQDFYKFDDELALFNVPNQGRFYPVSNDLFRAWSPTNTNTDVPSIVDAQLQYDTSNTNAFGRSDKFLVNSSFIRLKSVTLGYNVPAKFLKTLFIKNVKFYIQGENLVTWTKWQGLDPENFNPNGQGKYPNSKTLSFGVDLQF